MFALSSTLYKVKITQQPYHNKSDKDIKELFRVGDFPNTSALILREIRSRYWRVEYKDVGEAVNNIKCIQTKYVNAIEKQCGIIWWRQR